MISFIKQRVISLIPVVFVVSSLVFFLMHIVPGDPVDIILGDNATSINRQALRQQLGLDQPLFVQYKNYMLGLVQGDLGTSIYKQRPITSEILEALPATIELTIGALVLATLIGLPLGVLAAVKRNGLWDRSLSFLSMLGISGTIFSKLVKV